MVGSIGISIDLSLKGSGAGNAQPDNLPSSAMYWYSAVRSNSYPGTGDVIASLITSPADGKGSQWQGNLGGSSGSSTTDVTFNGTAGSPAAYFSTSQVDGSYDRISILNIGRSIQRWSSDQPFTVVGTIRTPPSSMNYSANGSAIMQTGANTASVAGVTIRFTAANKISVLIGDGVARNQTDFTFPTPIALDTDYFYAATLDPNTGAFKFYLNSVTPVVTGTVNIANKAEATSVTALALFRDWIDDTRFYQFQGFNAVLTDAEVRASFMSLMRYEWRNFGISLQTLWPSAVMDDDVTQLASSDGISTTISNLVAAPNDGSASASTAYDFSNLTGLVFVGSAGSAAAYLEKQTTGYLRIKNGNTAILNRLHQVASGKRVQPCTMFMSMNTADVVSTCRTYATQGGGSTGRGVHISVATSTEAIGFTSGDGTTAYASGSSVLTQMTIGTWTFIIVSVDEGGLVRIWVNNRNDPYAAIVSPPDNGSSADANLTIGATGNASQAAPVGTKWKSWGLLSEALTNKAEAGYLADYFRARHQEAYAG